MSLSLAIRFEDHGVSRKLVGKVGDLLAGFDCGVYLIPGNHDHWTLGGVWEQARERWSKRVHVLTEAKPVEVKGGWLYPCPLTQRWSDRDPTEWIPQESGDGIRIGLAHGSLRSPLWEGQQNHPIATDAAQRSGLDYLALGDWHSVKEVQETAGAPLEWPIAARRSPRTSANLIADTCYWLTSKRMDRDLV